MKIEINQNFLEAVEFPRLLDILTKDCQTPSGRDYLRMLRPLGETLAIEERLGKTRELEKQILKQAIPSIPDPQRFIEAFGNAREKGEAFSGKELTALLKFLRDVVRLRQYFSKQDYLPQPVQVGQNSSSTLTEPSEKAETIRDTSVENTVTGVFQGWLDRLHSLPELKDKLQTQLTDRGDIQDTASPELKNLRDRIRTLRSEVQNTYQELLRQQEAESIFQDRIITEREGRLVIPVRRDHQNQVPGFVHGVSASGATLFIEPEGAVESNNRIKEALLQENEEVRKILRELTQGVLEFGEKIEETLIASAEIDAHGALAIFASRYDAQFIEPYPGHALVLKAGRHPLLSMEAGKKFREKVIPLDIEFKEGVRVVLVSGPNAGGKTVALKTLGLVCLMAQSGLPVIAGNESTLPLIRYFDSDLKDGQSLQDHLSAYAAKLMALKRMLDHSRLSGDDGEETINSLFLLDELGAGTDPREGGALGLACLETFRERGAWVMANTHQPLLKLLTQEETGMANAAMLFDEVTGQPTYQLVSGIPGRSYALALASNLGFPEDILEKAKAHLPAGEVDLAEILTKLGGEKQNLEKARREAEKTLGNVRKMEAELLVARRQIKDEARRIKKEAQIEAEGLIKNARRKMEHLIQGVEKPKGTPVDRDKIKNARQEINRKLRNIVPLPTKKYSEIRELREGESVFFKSGNAEVKVVSADDEKEDAVILMGNGLKLSCKYSDLGKVVKDEKPKLYHAPPTMNGGSLIPGGVDEKGNLDLDLRGKLVDQALPLIDKFLDDALLVNLPFVRIIHGKGTGALKEAIHKHLPTAHPNVDFTLAEQAQGGAGVTVVKFKKN